MSMVLLIDLLQLYDKFIHVFETIICHTYAAAQVVVVSVGLICSLILCVGAVQVLWIGTFSTPPV